MTDQIGITCLQIFDRGRGEVFSDSSKYACTSCIVTSGSLVSLKVRKTTSLFFDEGLFLDWDKCKLSRQLRTFGIK